MSALPPEAPRLDPVPFIVADVLLVGAAAFIGWQAEAPLGVAPLACISALVGLGAIAGLYPFVVNHARRQEEALQDRANQIEALARTVGASAEQISIAVSNLPAIAENSARQLKTAEQLPAALQHQIAGLQDQIAATASEENAALRHELDTLRGAETAGLAAALEGLARSTADFARLEALAAKHSAALDGAIAHLPRLADSFVQQAGEALRRETAAAIAALQTAAAESSAGIAAATAEAREAFDRKMRDTLAQLAVQAAAIPPPPPVPIQIPVTPLPVPEVPAPAPEPQASAPALVAPEPSPEPAATEELAPASPTLALIDDAGLDEPAASAAETTEEPEDGEAEEPAAEIASEPQTDDEPASEESDADEETETALPLAETGEPALELELEPEPAPEASATEAVDAETASEQSSEPASAPEPEPARESEPAAAAVQEPAPESVAAAREPEPVSLPQTAPATSPSPAPEPDPEPQQEPEPEAPPAPPESALSHDGYTRLLATAYIGIGNRLFVRGDGPGLRRDKGVPLQFVSIGKWRWESAELLFPAKVRLYKNDQIECTALGEIVLEPGHHHEVNATF